MMVFYKTLAFILLFIDPSQLIGLWNIETFPAYEKLISSPRSQELSPDDYLKVMENYNTFMDSTFYRFSGDTVYFNDMREGRMVPKTGRWYLDQDTLIINDLEKIATYRFLVVSVDSQELQLKSILKRGQSGMVAKSPITYRKKED